MSLCEPYVVNRKTDTGLRAETVYIGRGGEFGNPFRIGKDGTRYHVLKKFEQFARNSPRLMRLIKELPEDAVLGCFCKPAACHGDVIVKLWKELNRR